MTGTASNILDWEPLIWRVAQSTVRDFPDSTPDDIAQEIWVGLLEAQQRGEMLSIDEKHAESGLYYLAKTAGSKERKQHLTMSPQYSYRTKDVRELLHTFFDRRDWESAQVPEDAESELNDVGLEMSSDLSRAWDKLSRPHKVLIYCHFVKNEKQDSKKLSKAISRMADIINTYQPKSQREGTGTRRVWSNARAQVESDLNYDDPSGRFGAQPRPGDLFPGGKFG